MSDKTLSECVQELFGFKVTNGPARFKKTGWFSVGQSVINCLSCSESMWAFRKPYQTQTGVTYHYWALVCSTCKSAFEPAKLDYDKRNLLYESSENKPIQKVTEIQDKAMVKPDEIQDKNKVIKKDELPDVELSLRPCVKCGNRIPRERTMKNPDAIHCVTCLSLLEGDFRQYIDEGIAGTREEHKSIRGENWSDLRDRDT
jgi:RNA polymerase-binding transcription factor DksA